MLKNIGRQGELLIIRCNKEEVKYKDLKKLNHRIIAEGEATGHKHELTAGTLLKSQWENQLFIDLKTSAQLNHPEHNTIEIMPGFYKIIVQREYTEEGNKRVRD